MTRLRNADRGRPAVGSPARDAASRTRRGGVTTLTPRVPQVTAPPGSPAAWNDDSASRESGALAAQAGWQARLLPAAAGQVAADAAGCRPGPPGRPHRNLALRPGDLAAASDRAGG